MDIIPGSVKHGGERMLSKCGASRFLMSIIDVRRLVLSWRSRLGPRLVLLQAVCAFQSCPAAITNVIYNGNFKLQIRTRPRRRLQISKRSQTTSGNHE